jgi:dTDP-4-dehydrorhamnose 3,5-epimerase
MGREICCTGPGSSGNMKFIESELKGAYIIELDPIIDERGFFARSFCKKEFEKKNLCYDFVQCNISHNKKKGTLRGMHYQKAPSQEIKIVSCIKGAIYDVIIDFRQDSATYLKWISVELTEQNKKMLYIPEDFAHGFQTLEDDSTVYYQMSEFYNPESACGLRWDDPAFKITWEHLNLIISNKDKKYDLFN